jgi:predicted MFS family arabinose efflux permease
MPFLGISLMTLQTTWLMRKYSVKSMLIKALLVNIISCILITLTNEFAILCIGRLF